MHPVSYRLFALDKSICSAFMSCGYVLRSRTYSGLWLIPLLPISLILSTWRHSSSNSGNFPVSNLYFTTTVVSVGLLISTVIYVMRFFPKIGVWIQDCNIVFVFPAIGTLVFLLYSQNGFLLSLIGGLLSSYGILAGLPSLLTVAPGCFTLGEAVIVVHAIVLFLFSSLVNIGHLALSNTSPMEVDHLSYETITAVLQIGFLGLILFLSNLLAFPILHKPKAFYCLFSIFVIGVISVSHILLKGSPLLWIVNLLTHDHTSIAVFVYWVVCSVGAVLFIWQQSSGGKKASTSQRKTFHVLAVAVFVGGLMYAPGILYLASGIVFAIFIILEAVRLLNIPPFSDLLQSGFEVFVDEKDNRTALTPLYLLAGVATPLWISPIYDIPIPKSHFLPLLSGILSIGIGDSAASFVGSRYGRVKWPGSSRTVEGSISCFISQLIAVSVMVFYGVLPGNISFLKVILSTAAITLVEAKTEQVDNLVLPLLLYIMLL